MNIGYILGMEFTFSMNSSNDTDVCSANKFIKFDGDAFEPIYFDDGSKYKLAAMNGNTEIRLWYVTKSDGSNWISQEDMNNGNIEDMEIYETIEEIPNEKSG